MAIMVLLVTYLLISTSASMQVESELNRTPFLSSGEAWVILDKALSVLKDTWDPEKQSFSLWVTTHPIDSLSWESLSGKVNLNTISPFVLGLPGFRDTLKGISVEKFTEVRSLKGPSANDALYRDLIQPVALSKWYTVHSLWNLNTADEIMLEAMASQRSGSPAVGSALRASTRSFRERMARIGPQDWVLLGGSGATSLEPLVTLEPELDVNEVPETLLSALVTNPAWKVTDPGAKVQTILQGRLSRPWTKATLENLLQVPADNLLLCYLGVRSRFLEGSVTVSGGRLQFVVFLPGKQDEPMAPRLVKTIWRAS